MQRRINNTDICMTLDRIGRKKQCFQVLYIGIVHILAQYFDQLFITAFKFDLIHFHSVNLSDNALIMRRDNLRTVFPIYLITVIYFRVVRSCNHYTTLTA